MKLWLWLVLMLVLLAALAEIARRGGGWEVSVTSHSIMLFSGRNGIHYRVLHYRTYELHADGTIHLVWLRRPRFERVDWDLMPGTNGTWEYKFRSATYR